WFWRDEYSRIPHKVFVDSDPAFTQLAIAKAEPWYVEFFQRFDRLFTFGANIGTPLSPIPVAPFAWHQTWQPVTLSRLARASRSSSPSTDRARCCRSMGGARWTRWPSPAPRTCTGISSTARR